MNNKYYKTSEIYAVNIIKYEKLIIYGQEQYRESQPFYRIYQITNENGHFKMIDLFKDQDQEYTKKIDSLKFISFTKINFFLKNNENTIYIDKKRLQQLYYELNSIQRPKPKKKILDINNNNI